MSEHNNDGLSERSIEINIGGCFNIKSIEQLYDQLSNYLKD